MWPRLAFSCILIELFGVATACRDASAFLFTGGKTPDPQARTYQQILREKELAMQEVRFLYIWASFWENWA